jgi:hypothetical protein
MLVIAWARPHVTAIAMARSCSDVRSLFEWVR